MYCGSSIPRPAISPRCSTQCSKRRWRCAKRVVPPSTLLRESAPASWRYAELRAFRPSLRRHGDGGLPRQFLVQGHDRHQRLPLVDRGRVAQGRFLTWGDRGLPAGGPSVLRQANRAAAEFCGTGGYRNSSSNSTALIAGAAVSFTLRDEKRAEIDETITMLTGNL